MRIISTKQAGYALSFALALAPFTAWADSPIGQIKSETGAVTVERGGASKPIAIGDHVFQSDTVVTAANGSVGITFDDNSMMSLGPNSRLALDQFSFNTTTHGGVFNAQPAEGHPGGEVGPDRAADARGDAYPHARRRCWACAAPNSSFARRTGADDPPSPPGDVLRGDAAGGMLA